MKIRSICMPLFLVLLSGLAWVESGDASLNCQPKGLMEKATTIDGVKVSYHDGGKGETVVLKTQAVLMRNTGHVPMLERPRQSANYYSGFLNQLWG